MSKSIIDTVKIYMTDKVINGIKAAAQNGNWSTPGKYLGSWNDSGVKGWIDSMTTSALKKLSKEHYTLAMEEAFKAVNEGILEQKKNLANGENLNYKCLEEFSANYPEIVIGIAEKYKDNPVKLKEYFKDDSFKLHAMQGFKGEAAFRDRMEKLALKSPAEYEKTMKIYESDPKFKKSIEKYKDGIKQAEELNGLIGTKLESNKTNKFSGVAVFGKNTAELNANIQQNSNHEIKSSGNKEKNITNEIPVNLKSVGTFGKNTSGILSELKNKGSSDHGPKKPSIPPSNNNGGFTRNK